MRVSRNGGAYAVRVTVDGFQTQEDIEATGKEEAGELVIAFDRHGEDARPHHATFSAGDRVVRLVRKPTGQVWLRFERFESNLGTKELAPDKM